LAKWCSTQAAQAAGQVTEKKVFQMLTPELQWFLGGRQLKDAEQTNETEAGDRRWKAVSVLKHAFTQVSML
jgi:hypothetical protein